MKYQKLSFYLTSASLLAVVLFGYQNCSQTHFSSDPDSAVLKAEAIAADSGSSQGDDGQVQTPAASTSPSPNPAASPCDNGKNPKKDGTDSPQSGASSDATADLVECELLHPNMKVVLDYSLIGEHGNSSSVRVCMSRNACLQLVNAFAVQHSCTLDASTPASAADAQSQCIKIFPGSKGTCHNATILSDDQVTSILQKMATQK